MDKPASKPGTIEEPNDSAISKGLTSDAPPEAKATVGEQAKRQGCPPDISNSEQARTPKIPGEPHWYVLRVTYGRERTACDYLTEHGCSVVLPTQKIKCRVNGRLRTKVVSLIPNMFFAHETEERLKEFVYDNYHLPYLRFYYEPYRQDDGQIAKRPLVVPDCQMDSFLKINSSEEKDTLKVKGVVTKFTEGQLVRVIAGPFIGVVGKVARYKGQQRVGVIIGNLFTVTTAYVPNSYLELVNDQPTQ